ncbi:MAG: Uma2 family endonuclease, partial [Bacteroidota bacterium]
AVAKQPIVEAKEKIVVEPKSPYEIERGKPMPSVNHAFVQKRLVVKLDIKYADKYEVLPELSINVIDRGRVPDIAICDLNIAFKVGEDTVKMDGTPLGVIEILSPEQILSELVEKLADYFQIGVKSYWLVIPDLRSIYVFDRPQNYEVFTWRDELTDPILDIQLNLQEIFK